MSSPLYLDSSSLLTWSLVQRGHEHVKAQVYAWLDGGGTIMSSRLLWLEARRVVVRERLIGNDVEQAVEMPLASVEMVPLTDDVWERAGNITQHVRALDAIHLATCELIGATLLTAGLDSTIHAVAEQRRMPLL